MCVYVQAVGLCSDFYYAEIISISCIKLEEMKASGLVV